MNAMLPLPVEAGHALLQREFALAILFDEPPIPKTIIAASGRASESRFRVYRNNVIAGLVNVLAARYPLTRKLLWPEKFDVVAQMYVTAALPRSPVLLAYGDGFPQFLRRIGHGASADYLADIAELEAARTRAYHAADAVPLNHSAFARIASDDLPGLHLTLHPSASLLKSRFPIVTMWEANYHPKDNTIKQWKAEAALIARPHLDVVVWRLSPGAYDFFTAIGKGQTVGLAITRALAIAPDFDLTESINILIASEIVVGIEPSAS
jgi:hypothetical protein